MRVAFLAWVILTLSPIRRFHSLTPVWRSPVASKINECNGDVSPTDSSEMWRTSISSLTCPTSSPSISAQ
jgi:hypothetical protein